jgi:pSer/pThr/pTyr-binding forkhead associated (FHA) protein
VVVEPRESRGQRFSVLESLTVGRADDNAVPMPDDTFISTHHATFQHREGALWIVDLNSTNGTFVNGQKVTGEKNLRSGDRVQLGSTVMEVH